MSKATDNEELRVITIEELKQFDGLGHLSYEQALEIIKTLKEVTLITHKIVVNYEQPRSVPKLRKA